jgi:hypothetical protein
VLFYPNGLDKMREVVIKWEIFALAFTVEIKENYCGLEKRAMAVQNY